MDINQTLKKNKKGTQLAKYCSFEQILLQQHTHTKKKSENSLGVQAHKSKDTLGSANMYNGLS